MKFTIGYSFSFFGKGLGLGGLEFLSAGSTKAIVLLRGWIIHGSTSTESNLDP